MTNLEIPRRKFLTGLGLMLAAPAIVQSSSIMPVKVLPVDKPLFTPGDIWYNTQDRYLMSFDGVLWQLASSKFSDFKLPNLAKVTGGGENFLNIEVLTNRVTDGKS
jgi:hypothetical protein